jgi:hypothetical protein
MASAVRVGAAALRHHYGGVAVAVAAAATARALGTHRRQVRLLRWSFYVTVASLAGLVYATTACF